MQTILDQIGNTPLVELTRLDTGKCKLFVKLENQNPGGSIKDRIALSMIKAAEESGALKPGGTIIEATAGNTGLALALVATLKGYKLQLVIPDKMSKEKVSHLRAMGAKIYMARSDVTKAHPEYYQNVAQRLADEIPGSFYVNQFGNPANPVAHEQTTGPEIWEQTGHKVDAVVCGVGSGGTISGLSRYFSRVAPQVEMVLADPDGSIVADYIHTGKIRTDSGSWLVEGIGEDFIPPIADLARVKKAYSISDKESFLTARELLLKEGVLGGSSSGTLVAAALRYCREQTTEKRVVTFICDTGNKYLSKMFNDYWMKDQGLIANSMKGNLADLIARRYEEGGVVVLKPDDSLLTAVSRMNMHEISQVPVVEGHKIVGLIDELDILAKAKGNFSQPVKGVMTRRLEKVSPSDSVETLLPLFERGLVAIVEDNGEFLGLITRIDLLNFTRRKAR